MAEAFRLSKYIEKVENVKPGIPYNLSASRVTHGLAPGNIITIMGGSKSGKTTLALDMLFSAMVNDQNKRLRVIYFSLEMSKPKMYSRLMTYLIRNVRDDHFFTIAGEEVEITPRLFEEGGYVDEFGNKHKFSADTKRYIREIEDNLYLDYAKRFTVITAKTSESLTPEKVAEKVVNLLNKRGELKSREIEEDGMIYTEDYFVPKNKDEIIVIVVDHVGLLHNTQKRTDLENMNVLASIAIDIRDVYENITWVFLIQTNRKMTSSEVRKKNPEFLAPGLGDANYGSPIMFASNMVFTVFNPKDKEYGNIRVHYGRNIMDYGDNLRFIQLKASRDTEPWHTHALLEARRVRFKELD